MTLTPDKIENYDPTHLIDTAEWIGRQHPRWDNHFINQQMDLMGMEWMGANGEKTLADATQDVSNVASLTAEATAAQATIMSGYTSLMLARGLAQTALESAKTTGYQVDSGFGVKDTLPPNPATQQARQALAEEHASNIANAVQKFQAEQQTVSQALRTHDTTLQNHVQMVDNHEGGSDTSHGTDHKRHMWDGMWEVGSGAGLALGGSLVTAGGLAGEVPSGGTDTGVTILGIAGVASGIKQFGDGVDDILNALEDK